LTRLFVIFIASGCMISTIGKATKKLIPHLFNVATVNRADRPFATSVFTPVTMPVIGSTNRKLWMYRL
jgi:hypothetical protein